MQKLIAIAICLLSTSAFASNFEGTWTGTGTYDSTYLSFNADPVFVEFKQTGSSLYSQDCWSNGNQTRCSARTFEIQGTELFYNGMRVGSISENALNIEFVFGPTAVKGSAVIQADGTLNFEYVAENSREGSFLRTEAVGLVK